MPHDSYFQSLSILFLLYSENLLNFILAFSNDFLRKDQQPQSPLTFQGLHSVLCFLSFYTGLFSFQIPLNLLVLNF